MTTAAAPTAGDGTAAGIGPAPWTRWLLRIRDPRQQALVSLAAGGVGRDDAVKDAHQVVAVHSPVEAARLRELYIRSQYLLLPAVAESCRRNIEDDLVATAIILGLSMNRSPGAGPASDADRDASAVLSDRVRRTEQCIAEQSETRALRYYARGLAKAMVYSLVLLTLIAISADVLLGMMYDGSPPRDVSLALYQTIVTIGGGAAGAALSVLLRKTDSIGDIDNLSLARAAVIRVTLGCIFAAALIFLVRGDIFTAINVPAAEDSGARTWFFWGGMGFLAGFNERWVRHIITRNPDGEAKNRDPAEGTLHAPVPPNPPSA
ncbi:MAG: hypothetical protein ACRDSP_07375 [Pseudonocardiaceae bacterium]